MKPGLLLRFALAEPEVGQNTAMRVPHTAGNSAFLVNSFHFTFLSNPLIFCTFCYTWREFELFIRNVLCECNFTF